MCRDTGIDVRLGVAVDSIDGDGKAQKLYLKMEIVSIVIW